MNEHVSEVKDKRSSRLSEETVVLVVPRRRIVVDLLHRKVSGPKFLGSLTAVISQLYSD